MDFYVSSTFSYAKRKNFSHHEIQTLMSCVEKHRTALEEKCTSAASNIRKHEAWVQITHAYNTTPNMQERTMSQLQNLYKNTKRRHRIMMEKELAAQPSANAIFAAFAQTSGAENASQNSQLAAILKTSSARPRPILPKPDVPGNANDQNLVVLAKIKEEPTDETPTDNPTLTPGFGVIKDEVDDSEDSISDEQLLKDLGGESAASDSDVVCQDEDEVPEKLLESSNAKDSDVSSEPAAKRPKRNSTTDVSNQEISATLDASDDESRDAVSNNSAGNFTENPLASGLPAKRTRNLGASAKAAMEIAEYARRRAGAALQQHSRSMGAMQREHESRLAVQSARLLLLKQRAENARAQAAVRLSLLRLQKCVEKKRLQCLDALERKIGEGSVSVAPAAPEKVKCTITFSI